MALAIWISSVAIAGSACARAGSWTSPAIELEFVRLPAGEYDMGSPVDEPGRRADEHVHRVALTRPFWIARTEVTQRQWRLVMGDDPSHFTGCDDCPVESVRFVDIQRFLERLAALEPDESYRLPTEGEWEYACRAGGAEAYGGAETLSGSDANFDARYPLPGQPGEDVFRGQPSPVATFPPNAWGLYDMSGNVWEWTTDQYCAYPDGLVTDPGGRCDSELLVIRGGSWVFGADAARCAMRYTHQPIHEGYSLGFRLVRDDPDVD